MPGGRPLKFDSPEDMQKAIDKYFDRCDENTIQVYDKKSESVVDMEKPIPYTIEGLCATLDMTRQSLLNYEKKDEFFDIIKKAKRETLQNQVECGLNGVGNSTMTIFLLKNNHDYRDKQEHDVTATHEVNYYAPKKDKSK